VQKAQKQTAGRLALKARQDDFSSLLLGILFMSRQRGIHFAPRVRVTCPHVRLWFEPARIIQARGSDGNNLRDGIGLDYNRRAAIRAKAPASQPVWQWIRSEWRRRRIGR
jgi:hypothetical protein